MQFRASGSFLLLLGALALFHRRALIVHPRDLWLFGLFGVVGIGLLNLAYYEAISRIPIGVALVVQYTATLMLLGIAVATGKKVRGRLWLAALLTLAGTYFVSGAYDASLRAVNTTGAAIALVSAVIFTAYYVIAARILERYGAWTLLVYGLATASLMWVLLRPPDQVPWAAAAAAWPLVLGVIVVGTVLPYGLTLVSLRLLTAPRVGLTSTFEPVVGALAAFAVLGEVLQVPQLLGGALVLAGIVIAQSLRIERGSV